MASELAAQRCEACNRLTPAVTGDRLEQLRAELHPGWEVVDGVQLRRRFRFPDFAGAFARLQQVAALAEEEGHHPDCCVGWGHLTVELTTHAIHGLSRNDFVLAAKIDALGD